MIVLYFVEKSVIEPLAHTHFHLHFLLLILWTYISHTGPLICGNLLYVCNVTHIHGYFFEISILCWAVYLTLLLLMQ